jgi:hypothetical protein
MSERTRQALLADAVRRRVLLIMMNQLRKQ